MITKRSSETETQLQDTELLLRNVKGAFQMQQDEIGKREDKIVREIQLLLLNDRTQWQQVKAQILHRLGELKGMGEVADFAESINEITARLSTEQNERKHDDQEIIDLLNDVCFKMSQKLQDDGN
uniref:Uncharacterized protein n=1 Tax=Favella ehrenbergii TaxID=182087 RepID=A0A7S3MKY7_9SPIT|mmetsp:Transcript_28/g.40  ORF Transcript_28/g.40 Transcript_28/m.40 type:complete len:125 (-) Transcript_28:73-447(-)